MNDADQPDSKDAVSSRRSIRLLTLLAFSERVGNRSLHISQLHVMAYLSDILAPVWNLPALDEQVLKRAAGPFFPALQANLDLLVGAGLVQPKHVSYLQADDGTSYLDAYYSLNPTLTADVLDAVFKYRTTRLSGDFTREVVYALSGVGSGGIEELGAVDAAYSNPMTDVGGVIDVNADGLRSNASAEVALQFQEILGLDKPLTAAEMTHLYIRHLYSRLTGA